LNPASPGAPIPERPVVDASVAVKWFLTAEDNAGQAGRLLRNERPLLVPDLIFPEVGNIVWKQVRKGELPPAEAVAIAGNLGRLGLTVFPAPPLIASAVAVACATGRTAYDSLYVALALQEGTVLVTADEKLFNALQGTEYALLLFRAENII